MESTVEREVKLAAPPTFSLARLQPRLDDYVASPVEWRRLHTTYWDTGDLRLTRWGCSLRFRLHEGWTLKLPVPRDGDALYREEHAFAGDADAVPPEALDLATAYLRGSAPRPVAELRTLRAVRHLRADGGAELAEVVEDDVRVVESSRVVQRFRQIEIELADGAPDDVLGVLAALLQAEGAGPPDRVPKNVRALGGLASEPEIVVPRLRRRSRAGKLARATLAASVERIVRYDARLRLNADAAAVHDARVAVRRIRSELRTLRPVLDREWACMLRERLRRLGEVLGEARDADVLLGRLERDAETLDADGRRRSANVLTPLRAARNAAYAHVRSMLRERDYVETLDALVYAAKDPLLNARASERARRVVPAIMRRAWKALRKAVRTRSRPPADRELHRIRIEAKQVRYAAESLVPVAGKRARRFADRVEQLQTVLGDQHDAVVAYRRLRRLAPTPDVAFVAGELASLEREAGQRGRRAWRRCWRAASRRKRMFWRSP